MHGSTPQGFQLESKSHLREIAEHQLFAGALRSTWAYPVFLLLISAGTDLVKAAPLSLLLMWCGTAVISGVRLFLRSRLQTVNANNSRNWMRATCLASAAIWGIFLLTVFSLEGASSWTFSLVQLCVIGAAAGVMTTYSIEYKLMAAVEVLMIAPCALAQLVIGDGGWVLGILYLCYLAFLLQQGKAQSKSYWQGIENQMKLEEHAKELEISREAALEASWLKSTFLANMSHELRTPLNAIIGYAELLAEELQERGQLDLLSDLDRIRFSGKHQLELVNQVLDLSKIESGRTEAHLESYLLKDLVGEITGATRPFANKNSNTFTVLAPEEDLIVSLDIIKVRQILINLLGNAHKFTADGQVKLEIEIERKPEGDWLRCSVTDTGIGMTSQQMERLFQPFVQADSSTSRRFGGTGLGLTISREFCRILGGTLTVQSEDGKGSCFTALLPVKVESVSPAAPQLKETEKGPFLDEKANTVLVIDDDPAVQDILSRHLSKEGFRVLLAADGVHGMQLARAHLPTAIVLDLILPGMDGWSILGQLQSEPELATIPVIMFSISDDGAKGIALGAAHFVAKPADFEKIATILRQYRDKNRLGTVMVVEDDPATQDLLKRQLEKQGWQTTVASDGQIGLEMLSNDFHPSAILLDLMMPHMDGLEFLSQLRLREGCKNIPVIVLTAKELTQQDLLILNRETQKIFQKGGYSQGMLIKELAHSLHLNRSGRKNLENRE